MIGLNKVVMSCLVSRPASRFTKKKTEHSPLQNTHSQKTQKKTEKFCVIPAPCIGSFRKKHIGFPNMLYTVIDPVKSNSSDRFSNFIDKSYYN
jgi:hypothetical protein